MIPESFKFWCQHCCSIFSLLVAKMSFEIDAKMIIVIDAKMSTLFPGGTTSSLCRGVVGEVRDTQNRQDN